MNPAPASVPRTVRGRLSLALAAAAALLAPTGPAAQQGPRHLNPVIDKLARGEPFFGDQTADLSFQNARTLDR
jgi:hypothetical protein